MERREAVALLVVGFLGLLSVAFGLGAEATRIKESQVTVINSKCVYPTSNPASGLAIAAILALAVAQVIIFAVTPLSCFRRNPNRSVANWTFATTCLVLNWIAVAIAIFNFLSGAFIDARRGEQLIHICWINGDSVYTSASSYSILSVILGIAYSRALFSVSDVSLSRVTPGNQIEIAIVQPIPATAQ